MLNARAPAAGMSAGRVGSGISRTTRLSTSTLTGLPARSASHLSWAIASSCPASLTLRFLTSASETLTTIPAEYFRFSFDEGKKCALHTHASLSGLDKGGAELRQQLREDVRKWQAETQLPRRLSLAGSSSCGAAPIGSSTSKTLTRKKNSLLVTRLKGGSEQPLFWSKVRTGMDHHTV